MSSHVLKTGTTSKNCTKPSCSWIPEGDTYDKHRLSQKVKDVAPQFQEETKGKKSSFHGWGLPGSCCSLCVGPTFQLGSCPLCGQSRTYCLLSVATYLFIVIWPTGFFLKVLTLTCFSRKRTDCQWKAGDWRTGRSPASPSNSEHERQRCPSMEVF